MIPIHTRIAAIDATEEAFRARAFEFGSCLSVIVDYFERLGLASHVADLPKIETPRDAAKLLGDQLMSEMVSARLRAIPPAMAMVGDLLGFEPAYAPLALDVGLGVCLGDYGLCWGDQGLERVSVHSATRAWRLPEA